MDSKYREFYLYYYAKNDLIENEFQWYREDADKNNIDCIIKKEFTEWLHEFEKTQSKTTT